MIKQKKYLLPICLWVMIFTSLICFAETSPMNCVQKNFDEIVSILKSPLFKNKTEKEQQNEMYEKLDSNFDFKIISMLALGRNWKRFSPGQRDEFANYFSKLVTKVYLSKIRGENLDGIKVDYVKTIDLKTKSRRSDVYTVLHNNGTKTPVVYRMMQTESNDWKAYDILVEGVSLIANYRDTYRTKSMIPPETIIKELKAKVEK
ncbi:MAG: ABC transporter substrate-binding protein [Desulfobacteraceae bacterium]|nr:ABC transporter substrate-binding protein [Desulfobacteraceae bacterium]